MIRLVLALVACLATSAQADPARLWSLPLPAEDVGVTQLAVVPERQRALAAVGNFDFQELWLIDLDTGVLSEVISPITTRYGGINHLAADAQRIAMLTDNGAGLKDRAFEVMVYDFETLTLQHRLTIPRKLKGYNPVLGSTRMWIEGDYLLLGAQLWEPYQNVKPYLLQYDLTTGAFMRTISMADMLPDADARNKAPDTPDYFFSGAVVSDGKLYSAPLPYDGPEPIRGIGFDLATGEALPALPIYEPDPYMALLGAVRDGDVTYQLSPPFGASNVISVGTVKRVDRTTSEVLTTYPDPFAPSETEMTLSDFIYQNIQTGLKPYTGSWYPEEISLDGGYLIASAPNAPAGGPVGSGALVVYFEDGTPYTILGSDAPKSDLFFGRGFAHSGSFVVATDKNPAIDHYATRSIVAYRLD